MTLPHSDPFDQFSASAARSLAQSMREAQQHTAVHMSPTMEDPTFVMVIAVGDDAKRLMQVMRERGHQVGTPRRYDFGEDRRN